MIRPASSGVTSPLATEASTEAEASAASAADAAEASASLLASVAKGEVTPDEAGRIMALLEAHKTIMAAGDLERRIAALEGAAR